MDYNFVYDMEIKISKNSRREIWIIILFMIWKLKLVKTRAVKYGL
jgi:hypothetical protein